MDNSKQAVYPITWRNNTGYGTEVNVVSGITKLEYFSGLAMQGFCSDMGSWKMDGKQLPPEELARMSIVSAKALLSQLENEK